MAEDEEVGLFVGLVQLLDGFLFLRAWLLYANLNAVGRDYLVGTFALVDAADGVGFGGVVVHDFVVDDGEVVEGRRVEGDHFVEVRF